MVILDTLAILIFGLNRNSENAQKVIQSLIEFGFGFLDVSLEDLTTADNVIQLGYPPNRIDLLTSVTGLEFKNCWGEKTEVHFENEKINFISLHHLKINKKETGRTQDKLNLENLP